MPKKLQNQKIWSILLSENDNGWKRHMHDSTKAEVRSFLQQQNRNKPYVERMRSGNQSANEIQKQKNQKSIRVYNKHYFI